MKKKTAGWMVRVLVAVFMAFLYALGGGGALCIVYAIYELEQYEIDGDYAVI